MDNTLNARSMRSVSSVRSRSWDSGSVSSRASARVSSSAASVCAPRDCWAWAPTRYWCDRPAGVSGPVEVLGHQRRFCPALAEYCGDLGVGLRADLEHLGLIGRVPHQGMPEPVDAGAADRPAR